MPDPAAGIRVLSFSDPVLTSAAVSEVERALRSADAPRDARPVILDCQTVTRVTAAGLSALLELGRSAGGLQTLALTRLSRTLTLAAVQAGLAERFVIYATPEACLHELSRAEPSA